MQPGPRRPNDTIPTAEPADVLDPIEVDPGKRGESILAWVVRTCPTVVAWMVILALIVFVLYRNAERTAGADGKNDNTAARMVAIESQGRYLVGAVELIDRLGQGAGKQNNRQEMYRAAQSLDSKTYSQRLRFATLAGELAGPEEATEALDRLEKDRKDGNVEARDASIEAARLLRRLYRGYIKDSEAPPALSDKEQERLRAGLGWFGELALSPRDGDPEARERVIAPAIRTTVTYFSMFFAFLLGFLAGLVLLVIAVVLAFKGKLRSGLAGRPIHGGIYAETFALYMLSYFGITLILGFVLSNDRIHSALKSYTLLLSAGAMLLSLVVLAWPVVRGVPWKQVREDLGLDFGGRPGLNVLFGPLTYLCAVPLFLLGILIMLGLMVMVKRFGLGTDPFDPGAGPSHPIVNVALQKDWLVWLQVFLVASVAAPIVEEIMFRGVLYRHLRETSYKWGRRLSIVFSVLLSSFIFAVIHPQGWLGVPVLMGLAIVFALAREWRGSLVPPMIAHGINNGVALLTLFLVAG
jgi:membrane protease YdiL (CAAX protease family)